MQPVPYAIQNVIFSIPKEILEKAFLNYNQYGQVNTIENMISVEVIQARVMPDCNILGGKMKSIILKDTYYEPLLHHQEESQFTDDGIYRIPSHARDNVDIVAVISTSFTNKCHDLTGVNGIPQGGNTALIQAHEITDSHTLSSVPNMPLPKVINGNLIQLSTPLARGAMLNLNCRLAYDINMTNLPKSAVMPFSELVILATKAHIFNKLVIAINHMEVTRGKEIGVVKDIIDDYRDANEQYKEKLLNFRSGSMQDEAQKRFLLAHML